MDDNNIKPLNVSFSKGVLNGTVYDILTPEEYIKYKTVEDTSFENLAVMTKYNGEDIILPVIADKEYTDNVNTPGVYLGGPLSIYKYPKPQDINKYKPTKMVTFSNNDTMEQLLEKNEVLSAFDQPWVTATDSTTICQINETDQPEMVAIKSALNAKHVDFDSYASRFGPNFPNNKRQLKNSSATLKFIKTFCEALDLDAELILKDKNAKVPNPMNKVIHVSLTDLSSTENKV